MKSVTIQMVARHAGVSTATVSRALSNPGQVADRTRAAVLEAVAATGYSVNRAARSLRLGEAGAIIVLVPNLGNPFFSEILAGIEAEVAEEALNVMVLDTDNRQSDGIALVQMLAEGQGDGIISLDGRIAPAALENLSQSAFADRLVFACEWVADTDYPSVRSDNAAGITQLMDHLIGLGHRDIGYVDGPEGNVLSTERRRAYCAAMAGAGLPVGEGRILSGDFTLEAGHAAALRIASMHDRPSAIVCASDQMAIGAIGGFQRLGLRVPGDVSVAGFDDIAISGFVWPGLTTVRQDRTTLGRRAASWLIDRLRQRGSDRNDPFIVPVELVVRETTAAPGATPKNFKQNF